MDTNMSKKKLIPFGWLPGHIGLAGKTREIAQAEYELEGFALQYRLLEIKQDEMTADEYGQKLWDLQLKNGHMDQTQYNRNLTELIKDPVQKALAVLELDHREGKIKDVEYEKQSATLRKEPWVNIVGMDFSKGTSLEGSFELDWNEYWVEKLKSEGYTGPTPDNIVNQWFMELSRNVAMEEFDGVGDFTPDSAANLEAVKRWGTSSEPIGKDRKGYK
jgi:hypothetical protein